MKIDIIIPTLNSERNIKTCLNSIQLQTLENSIDLNIIIVDGGSFDSTLKIAKTFHAEIFLNKRKPDTIGSCRQLGLQNSKGDYLLFLDSDEILEKNFFKELKISLKRGFRLISCQIIPKIKSFYTKLYSDLYYLIPRTAHEFKNFQTTPIRVSAVNVAKKVQFDPNLHVGEDLDFSYRVIGNNLAFFDPNLIIYHDLPKYFYKMLFKEIKYGSGVICLFYKFRNRIFLKYCIENVLYTISPPFFKRIFRNSLNLSTLESFSIIFLGLIKSLMNYIGYIYFILKHSSAYRKRYILKLKT